MSAGGPVSLGANDGHGLSVVQDPFWGPYKLMNMTGLFGTVDQDRFAGVRADLGRVPATTPITTALADLDTGVATSARTDAVYQDALPFLSAFHLWDAADSTLDRWGRGTSKLSWTASGTREDGSGWAFTRDNLFASDYDIGFDSLFELWDLLSVLQFNDFEVVGFTAVEIAGEFEEAVNRVRIGQVLVSVDGGPLLAPGEVEPAQPGSVIDLEVTLVGKGLSTVVSLTLTVPEDAFDVVAIVVHGGNLGFWDDEAGMLNGDHDTEFEGIERFDDLLGALESLPQNNDVVARIFTDGGYDEEPVEDPDFGVYVEDDGAVDRQRVDSVVRGEAFFELPVDADGFEEPTDDVARLAGTDRVVTAIAVSQDAFADEGMVDTVVVARADDHADALAGGPLAASVGGPLLLTPTSSLPGAVAEEIQRLGATRAIMLGGSAALSGRIADDLREPAPGRSGSPVATGSTPPG